ncbi:hypothetical protein TNCV_2996981 [Trichonephila clavipes]|nr:hypothetical protein TNCV_2996981 [Trichonephila clavipes]
MRPIPEPATHPPDFPSKPKVRTLNHDRFNMHQPLYKAFPQWHQNSQHSGQRQPRVRDHDHWATAADAKKRDQSGL